MRAPPGAGAHVAGLLNQPDRRYPGAALQRAGPRIACRIRGRRRAWRLQGLKLGEPLALEAQINLRPRHSVYVRVERR